MTPEQRLLLICGTVIVAELALVWWAARELLG